MQFFILNLKFEMHVFRPRRRHRPRHHLSFRMTKHNEDDKSAAIDFALSRYGIEIAETSATPVSLCSRRELSHAPA
jgi:hypothetical protein